MIELNAGQNFSTFVPIRARSQVVAGTNWRVQYRVGNGQVMEVQVFEPLTLNGMDGAPPVEVSRVNITNETSDSSIYACVDENGNGLVGCGEILGATDSNVG